MYCHVYSYICNIVIIYIKKGFTIGHASKRKPITTKNFHIFKGSQFFYIVFVTFFGALFFTVPYLLYLSALPQDITLFGYILGWNILSGICAGFIARVLTLYSGGIWKTFQTLMKNLINSLIYSTLIFFGLLQFIFSKYQIDYSSLANFIVFVGTSAFWELVMYSMVLKLIIYLASDFISDKITFGPS